MHLFYIYSAFISHVKHMYNAFIMHLGIRQKKHIKCVLNAHFKCTLNAKSMQFKCSL